MADAFEVEGANDAAAFTLKVRRGERMALLAMNWRNGTPPAEFVGFAIEYQEPNSTIWHPLKNRLNFTDDQSQGTGQKTFPSLEAPFQKFRWVHFPFHAELEGTFNYRVTSVFMDNSRHAELRRRSRLPAIELDGDTYPGAINVAFTRGFMIVTGVRGQLREGQRADHPDLRPATATDGLDFQSHASRQP